MTVCIAALCADGTIFGATDRMLTAGDVEFEPSNTNDRPRLGSKMVFLTSSIVAMTAGDSALQSELIQEVLLMIGQRLDQDKAANTVRWLGIKEVAEMYRAAHAAAKRARATHRILAPLSLDIASFVARQGEMNGDFVKQVTAELLNFQMPPVAVIFAGVDETGSHIYTVDGTQDSLHCHDSVGFAAIGSGGWHAQTQFMLAGHDRRAATVPETLFLTYLAKKRSEVAPGVGSDTDMFIAGPHLGSATSIGSHVVERVEDIYKKHAKSEAQAFSRSKKETLQYVEQITKASDTSSATKGSPAIDDQSPPPDGTGVQVDSRNDA